MRQRQAATEAAASSCIDEDVDEDAATSKARAWDDWKDDHPRGEGNSRLRPTA